MLLDSPWACFVDESNHTEDTSYLIVTWRDNVFFSSLAPKQSVDKSREDPCGKVKYKDSLGSRCFPFNDSLTGEVLSRTLLFIPAVCSGLEASPNLPW